jgi:hypothetical protein
MPRPAHGHGRLGVTSATPIASVENHMTHMPSTDQGRCQLNASKIARLQHDLPIIGKRVRLEYDETGTLRLMHYHGNATGVVSDKELTRSSSRLSMDRERDADSANFQSRNSLYMIEIGLHSSSATQQGQQATKSNIKTTAPTSRETTRKTVRWEDEQKGRTHCSNKKSFHVY